jgi:hypothetical protein
VKKYILFLEQVRHVSSSMKELRGFFYIKSERTEVKILDKKRLLFDFMANKTKKFFVADLAPERKLRGQSPQRTKASPQISCSARRS